MAISERLKAFLEGSKIPYTVRQHPVVYTAQEIAAAQHVPGRQLAKSVLVTTERGPVLAVLPAIHRINLKQLKSLLRTARVTLATEAHIKQHFTDLEVGAMSVFGQLYQIPVVIEKALTESQEIVCNAGTHTETVTVRYVDVAAAVKPTVGSFGQSPAGARAKSRKATPTPSATRTRGKPARAKKTSTTRTRTPAASRSYGSRRRR